MLQHCRVSGLFGFSFASLFCVWTSKKLFADAFDINCLCFRLTGNINRNMDWHGKRESFSYSLVGLGGGGRGGISWVSRTSLGLWSLHGIQPCIVEITRFKFRCKCLWLRHDTHDVIDLYSRSLQSFGLEGSCEYVQLPLTRILKVHNLYEWKILSYVPMYDVRYAP